MIDPRTPAASVATAERAGIDWRNAYLGPGSGGRLSAWPEEAAQATGAELLRELHLGVVLSPNEGLRELPAHTAALLSELWMGEFVRVLREEDGWWLVRAEDGYLGWMRAWASQTCSPAERDDLLRRRVGVFSAPSGWLRGKEGVLSPLMGGSPLLALDDGAHHGEFGLADGSRGQLEGGQLETGLRTADPARLVDHALSLLGTAYRWGGRTPGGIDCSGLVQWAALRSGFQLARDAIQQAAAGDEIALDPASWRRGDLLYFHSPVDHVGIYDGRESLVHARARVRVQSLAELSELLDGLVRVRRLGVSQQIQEESLWRRIPRVRGISS